MSSNVKTIDRVRMETLADGRVVLSGNTFAYKDAIKAASLAALPMGTAAGWDAATKGWTVAAGSDLSFIKPPAPAPVAPRPAAVFRRARDGWCCQKAKAEFDPHVPQGPMWYVCPDHGRCKSNWAGD
jgi:hypothetical protein